MRHPVIFIRQNVNFLMTRLGKADGFWWYWNPTFKLVVSVWTRRVTSAKWVHGSVHNLEVPSKIVAALALLKMGE